MCLRLPGSEDGLGTKCSQPPSDSVRRQERRLGVRWGGVPLSSLTPLLGLLSSAPWSPPPPCSLLQPGPTLPLFRIRSAYCLAGTLRLKTTHIPVSPSRSRFRVNRQRGLLPLACGGSALPSPKWTWSLPDAADTGSVPPGSVQHCAGHQPCASSVGTGTKSPPPPPSSSPSPAWLPAPLPLRGEDPSLEG